MHNKNLFIKKCLHVEYCDSNHQHTTFGPEGIGDGCDYIISYFPFICIWKAKYVDEANNGLRYYLSEMN